MSESQALILTGMHRSGTSMVSSLFEAAGVHMGDELLTANSANPRGYFEDVDFYEFHERLLHQRKQSYLYLDGNCSFVLTPEEVQHAQRLVEARRCRALWGWKDPRTALFLPFWKQQLPTARFVFLFRHPLEVLLSLLRRGEFDRHPFPVEGLQAWRLYNSRILDFFGKNAGRCLLIHLDGLVNGYEQLSDLLRAKLQLPLALERSDFDRVFHPHELRRVGPSGLVDELLKRIFPEVFSVYEAMKSRADLPAPQSAASASSENASPPLQRLAQFVRELPSPTRVGEQHALLQLLLEGVAPEPSEKMLRSSLANVRHAQQAIDQLWLQVQQLNRHSGKLQAECDALRQERNKPSGRRFQLWKDARRLFAWNGS